MILHPASVHFPISLLIISGLCYLYSFVRNDTFTFQAGRLMHSIGIIGVVLAIITGKITSSTLDPQAEVSSMLWQHELLAYGTLWSFSMLWVWQYMRKKVLMHQMGSKWERTFFVVIFLGALTFMSYSSYLGGKMVYEHGLGVQTHPSPPNE